ncbi:sodium ion-translocating decarboxylase subunit beta [Erysipelothrix sp. D19-032]
MDILIQGIMQITIPQIIMMVIGLALIYLGIVKEYEPTLLVPMGLGAILVNFPNSGLITQPGRAGRCSKHSFCRVD